MRKMFQAVFVKKPIGFMLFLAMGIVVFLFVAMSVRIPVYDTVDVMFCQMEKEESVLFKGKLGTFLEGEPIYVYESREKQLIKLENYQIKSDGISSNQGRSLWRNDTKLKLDVPIKKQSLLEVIVKEGGNI